MDHRRIMTRKLKLPDGSEVEGTAVEFITTKEEFNEYQLLDGKRMRVKGVVTNIYRLDQQRDVDGNPALFIMTHNVVVVE